ncbi:hypothetical protein [Salipaludibacillus sp. CUR1]|nr:hypothetical protein [Salipaludibacillus sp. CUR1]
MKKERKTWRFAKFFFLLMLVLLKVSMAFTIIINKPGAVMLS